MSPQPHADADAAGADFERLLAAFFDAVSFAPGKAPAYGNIRALFIDAGLLIKNSAATPEISTVDQFVAPRQAMFDAGQLTRFRESELSGLTEVFGNVGHRFSVYAKSGTQNGVSFDVQGMISTQFVRTPAGWRISAMAWDDERPGLSIAERNA